MEKNVIFAVNVIGCNAETFKNNYGQYIQAYRNGVMDNKVFYLSAPQSIMDEISSLTEEGIEISSYL